MARYLAGGGRGAVSVSVTPTDIELTDTLVALHELMREFPQRVRISFRHLGVHEYYVGMAASTAIVAPYSYGRFRPSGLVIESAALGVPLIGLAGGFAEDELGGLRNGSLFLPRPTPALLSQALLRFDEEHAERGARARIAAKRYAGRQGTEALLRCLFGDGS
jgi:glycosyltransferase involved in cell wall biosynthesis